MTATECCLECESFLGGYEIVPDGQTRAVGERLGQFCHQLFAVLFLPVLTPLTAETRSKIALTDVPDAVPGEANGCLYTSISLYLHSRCSSLRIVISTIVP